MLVFNEGVPRAGKSYDAVKSHILPALKARRRVYARLNGLNKELIADYLGMPHEEIDDLLTLVESGQVKNVFRAGQDELGAWTIDDELKDSLCVIDEVHEFFVASRQPLDPEHEQFFALIGQNGGDVVIMTQWIKRCHAAVRARIERKNVFQKLTAVGLKKKYRVTHWHTTSPDRYEKVGGATHEYEPAIYPLYKGYADGADNTEVYDQGGRTVWKAMLGRAAIIVPLGIFAIWYLLSFFAGGGESLVKESPNYSAAPTSQFKTTPQQTGGQGQHVAQERKLTAKEERELKREEALAALTPEQRYVFALGDKARPRLMLVVHANNFERAMVEWVDHAGVALDRMDLKSLRSLGIVAKIQPYGVRLSAGDQVAIVTQWPLNKPPREPEARLYDTSQGRNGDGTALATKEQPPSVVGITNGRQQPPPYGGMAERDIMTADETGYSGGGGN